MPAFQMYNVPSLPPHIELPGRLAHSPPCAHTGTSSRHLPSAAHHFYFASVSSVLSVSRCAHAQPGGLQQWTAGPTHFSDVTLVLSATSNRDFPSGNWNLFTRSVHNKMTTRKALVLCLTLFALVHGAVAGPLAEYTIHGSSGTLSWVEYKPADKQSGYWLLDVSTVGPVDYSYVTPESVLHIVVLFFGGGAVGRSGGR